MYLEIEKKWKQIQEELAYIRELKNKTKDEYENMLSDNNDKFVSLREYYSEKSYCLLHYHQQGITAWFGNYHKLVSEVRSAIIPRKKFQFSRKAKESKKEKKDTEMTEAEQENIRQKTTSRNDLIIKNTFGRTIRKTFQEYEGKENIILDDIEDCEIYLPFIIKSIYAKKLKRVKVFAGCVTGASFINEAVDCEFHMQSHQIRIHNTTETSFHLFAKSNPIIEHCQKVKFHPFDCHYA